MRAPGVWSTRSAPAPEARGRRRFPARLRAVDQGRARVDGAGGGTAARAGRRNSRSPDRRQAQGRRLGAPRSAIGFASGFGLRLDAGADGPRHSPRRNTGRHRRDLVKRLGLPAVRTATRQAMRLLGSHFVLGQTIEEALSRAGSHREFLYSFDMLGEAARTGARCRRYFESYANAIDAIGKTRATRRCQSGPAFP